MTTIRKTITLTEHQNEWIKAQVAAGDFTNESECIRALIRRDQAYQAQAEAIRQALRDGEESGIAQGFTFEGFLEEMNALDAE